MAKFCSNCGNPVQEDALFCDKCGARLTQPDPGPAQTPVPRAAEPAAARPRTALEGDHWLTVEAPNEPTSVNRLPGPSVGEGRSILPRLPVSRIAGAVNTSLQGTAASVTAGEVSFGEFGGSELDGARSIPGPIRGIFRGLGSLLVGILRMIRNPLALVGTLALALLWFVVNQFRDWNPQVMEHISWLTYARGGLTQGLPGMVGGALGKGTVAAALISLFTGGLVSAFKGIAALFTGHGEKRSVPSVVIGVVIGAALCFVLAGKRPSVETAMAGIAGAMLSLEALGSGRGKLYDLVQSLTSRAEEGVLTAVSGRCDGLLTGLTLGFAGVIIAMFCGCPARGEQNGCKNCITGAMI